MNALDFVLLGVIVFFTLWGFIRGLVKMLGGLVVSILAGLLAGRVGEMIVNLVNLQGSGSEIVLQINRIYNISFWLAFVLLMVVGHIALRFVDILTSLPIISGLKKMGGAFLGLIQGLLIAGFIAVVLSSYPLWNVADNSFLALADESVIVRIAAYVAGLVTALWPGHMRDIASVLRSG